MNVGIHLRNLVTFATGKASFKSVGQLGLEELKKGWNESTQGMQYALNFLCANAGIDRSVLLSSPTILIVVANYVHSKGYELTKDDAVLLRYWALVANAKSRYSGASETILDQDLGLIRQGKGVLGLLEALRAQVGRLDVHPRDLENRNTNSGLFKTMFLAFREQGATDWRDQLKIDLKHSGIQHSIQTHHIFPQDLLKDQGREKTEINDISNLAFISGRKNREIGKKEPYVYLPEIIEQQKQEALTKQSIPTDKTLWKLDAYDDFLKRRRELIAECLNEFLGHDTVNVFLDAS